jgi:hypothetical protein
MRGNGAAGPAPLFFGGGLPSKRRSCMGVLGFGWFLAAGAAEAGAQQHLHSPLRGAASDADDGLLWPSRLGNSGHAVSWGCCSSVSSALGVRVSSALGEGLHAIQLQEHST